MYEIIVPVIKNRTTFLNNNAPILIKPLYKAIIEDINKPINIK